MKKVVTKKVTIDDLSNTIDNLAIMVAKGFDSVHNEITEVKKDITEVKRDIAEVKENLATTRMDVLGIGDKFVSRHDFNQHLIRFDLLEQKVKAKK